MKTIAVALKGKGPLGMLKRAGAITKRCGVSRSKMNLRLRQFARILDQFGCGAALPITASVLARSKKFVESYRTQNIEFAVHGYHHVDHTQLTLEAQLTFLEKARRLFEERGVTRNGFRCPYLRWDESTLAAVEQAGFLYDSSQALAWDIGSEPATDSYLRALEFYGAVSATQYPALPRFDNGLVRVPYCLPDDEALIDRFQLGAEPMSKSWLTILDKTHALGELFTLGLHPERILVCQTALIETLSRARELSPGVWIARLDEIVRWWKAHSEAAVTITQKEENELFFSIEEPKGVTVLARGVEVMAPSERWGAGYQRVQTTRFSLRAPRRPFIGVSPSSSPYLVSFLRQQGYILEEATNPHTHTFYLDRPLFAHEDERALLAKIEQGDFPLLRLGRWPNGFQSSLCITGDIDALTVWDYGLRFLGR
jgi:hypothetical protein